MLTTPERARIADELRSLRPRRDEWYDAVTYYRVSPGEGPGCYTEPANASRATRVRILRVRAWALRREGRR